MLALRRFGPSVPPADPVVIAVRREEGLLLGTLAGWAVLSVTAGAGLWWKHRRDESDAGRLASDAGRQTVVWGLVDAVIAVRGLRGRSRAAGSQPTDRDARRRGRRLAALTGANAVLDVGYVAGGAALAVRSPRRRGDGVAVAVQGLFLLWLDMRHSSRFLRHVRAERG